VEGLVPYRSAGDHKGLPYGNPKSGSIHRCSPTVREFIWTPDASLGSGVYFIKISNNETVSARKVLLIK
jgi:hypothetical protein